MHLVAFQSSYLYLQPWLHGTNRCRNKVQPYHMHVWMVYMHYLRIITGWSPASTRDVLLPEPIIISNIYRKTLLILFASYVMYCIHRTKCWCNAQVRVSRLSEFNGRWVALIYTCILVYLPGEYRLRVFLHWVIVPRKVCDTRLSKGGLDAVFNWAVLDIFLWK